MEKEAGRQRKIRIKILAVCLFAVLMFAAAPKGVQAAGTTSITVRVNGQFTAYLQKKGSSWYLKPKDTKKIKVSSLKGVQYLKIPKGKGFGSGYYYFYKTGRLDTRKVFHTLDTKVNGQRFCGEYYFGSNNGKLYRKKGWITIKNKKYYLTSLGKKCKNCWKSGYYLKSNGQIAKNMKTPDGYYVDCDGRKCKKSEMKLSSLKKTLTSMIGSYSGSWSVYVKDLKTGDVLSINDTAMYPASVIKLFVMASTYQSIKSGNIAQTSYVNSLLNQMITVSDNESFNALVRLHSKSGNFAEGCSVVNSYLKKISCTKTSCHHILHPSSSASTGDGHLNMSSAKDAGILLEKIYKGTCVSKKYSQEMLNLLLRQTKRYKIPSGLPAGTKVANKTGETSSYQHDVAIVYGPKTNYVVCIFSNTGESASVAGIRNLSAAIYNYLN